VGSIGYAGLSSTTALIVATFCAGLIVLGIQSGINVVGAMIYPTLLRANGSGWQLGIGRLGAIAGPMVGALLVGSSGRAALYAIRHPLRRRRRGVLPCPCS
jgi:AAHS family 4-hydroxybenzoate transporter-like MFS transporter